MQVENNSSYSMKIKQHLSSNGSCVSSLQEFSDLHEGALRVISNCLEDSESMQLIQTMGGLEQLLQFVGTSTLPEAQANAVKAIARMAQSSTEKSLSSLFFFDKWVCTLYTVRQNVQKQLVTQRYIFVPHVQYILVP